MKGKHFISKKLTVAISLVVMLTMCTTAAYATDYNTDDTSIENSDIDEHLKGAEIYKSSETGTSVMNQMIGDNKKYIIDDVDNIYYSSAIEDKIIEFTNKFREENGLEPLKKSETLRFSARYKNASMAKFEYFEHKNPNMDSCSAGKLSTNLGCDNWCAYGENIYQMSSTRNVKYIEVSAYEIFNAWKNSPGHRANMLQEHYTYIGAAVSICERNGSSYVYSTQHFFGDADSGEPINNDIKVVKAPAQENPATETPNKAEEEKPVEDEKPAEETPKQDEEEKPAEETPKQDEEEKPAEETPKQDEEEKPAEETPKQDEEEKPAEETPKQEEEEKPAEETPKQDDEEKPAEEQKPVVDSSTQTVSDNTEKAPTKTSDSSNIFVTIIGFFISTLVVKGLIGKKQC